MKAIQLNRVFFLLLVIVGFTTSCVQDDDYDLPDTSIVDPELPEGANIVSISSVLGVAGQQDDGEQFTFNETNNFMEGYVISTDEGGNFFREIILQDKAENPEAGIKISLFVNPLFTKYEVGRKIYVSLDGFTVGTSNGVITLGIPDGNFIDEAPAQFENKIYRTSEIAEIVPLELTVNQFSNEYENLFVKLTNVQFLEEDVNNNLTFASEGDDEFDGERLLVQYNTCYSIPKTTFSTSTFADFASLSLPDGSGSISGVLSRNFEDDKYVISINSISDVQIDSPRFDILDEEGNVDIFLEDFESGNLATNGWVNYIEAGSRNWAIFNDSENTPSMGTGVKIGSFGSNDESTITWLVSQAIDFDVNDGETLSFKTSNSFSDKSELKALISTDWDGDTNTITDATWNVLASGDIVTDTDFFRDVIPSGVVDLSCVSGTGYIAFKYIGSGDEAEDGTFELDDIRISY